mmetsp:Transcript_59525/g.159467  ORF Transcript_59525/g.159467 Transcript_59525/m.159467 type:complete len:218 (+) Transcript_59525:927-1580(+)
MSSTAFSFSSMSSVRKLPRTSFRMPRSPSAWNASSEWRPSSTKRCNNRIRSTSPTCWRRSCNRPTKPPSAPPVPKISWRPVWHCTELCNTPAAASAVPVSSSNNSGSQTSSSPVLASLTTPASPPFASCPSKRTMSRRTRTFEDCAPSRRKPTISSPSSPARTSSKSARRSKALSKGSTSSGRALAKASQSEVREKRSSNNRTASTTCGPLANSLAA